MTCCAIFDETVDEQFTLKKAQQELERYRQKGAGPTARLLLEGLDHAGALDGTLVDIGAGVGALTFELLDRGITRAVIVEASAAYAKAASDESERRGRTKEVELTRGDFVEVGATVPTADVVTLDRVVCCYPVYEPLLGEAIRHTGRALALSYPRDRWYVRAVMSLDNALRRRKNKFRTFVHPESQIRQMITRAGFELIFRKRTLVWSADVFVRRG
jgi:SAM-dependent methyltransferase